MSPTNTPPGWYPIPEAPGWQRWWDGTQWTEATIPPGPATTPLTPPTGANAPPPPATRRWPLVAAVGGVALILIAVVAVVIIRPLLMDDEPDPPPGATPPAAPTNTDVPTNGDSIPFDGDLATARVDALLPDGHNERGRQVVTGPQQDLLVLSHPEEGRYVTVSLLRAGDGALSVVDRGELRCSYDEEAVGASGGAQLWQGDGVGYATCFGWVDSAIMDVEMTLPTRVWALEPADTTLQVHPDHEQGWPTVGFQLASGQGGEELLLPVCADRNCSEEQYTYAVHVARDPASQSFQAVACSEPGGPRTEMPGGPWDASDNPELTPPDPDRGCGPDRYVRAEPTMADVEAIALELCGWLADLEAAGTDEAMLASLREIDELRFNALALGLMAPDDLDDFIGDTCPQLRWLWEEFLVGSGYR